MKQELLGSVTGQADVVIFAQIFDLSYKILEISTKFAARTQRAEPASNCPVDLQQKFRFARCNCTMVVDGRSIARREEFKNLVPHAATSWKLNNAHFM